MEHKGSELLTDYHRSYLRQKNPIYIRAPYLCKIHFNIIIYDRSFGLLGGYFFQIFFLKFIWISYHPIRATFFAYLTLLDTITLQPQ